MKSKATFDLNFNNQPVIRAEIYHSDDVRDKIAERFKAGFAHESNIAIVTFDSYTTVGSPVPADIVEILPLSPYETVIVNQLHNISVEQMEHLIKIFTKEVSDRKSVESLTKTNIIS